MVNENDCKLNLNVSFIVVWWVSLILLCRNGFLLLSFVDVWK